MLKYLKRGHSWTLITPGRWIKSVVLLRTSVLHNTNYWLKHLSLLNSRRFGHSLRMDIWTVCRSRRALNGNSQLTSPKDLLAKRMERNIGMTAEMAARCELEPNGVFATYPVYQAGPTLPHRSSPLLAITKGSLTNWRNCAQSS